MEISLAGLIVIIVVSVVVCVLAYMNIALRVHNKKVFKTLVQSEIDREALIQMLTKVELENENKNGDGFIKFLSESRDWAFTYIEKVQEAIKNFQDSFQPIATNYEIDKSLPISQEDIEKAVAAYNKLVEEIPKEERS